MSSFPVCNVHLDNKLPLFNKLYQNFIFQYTDKVGTGLATLSDLYCRLSQHRGDSSYFTEREENPKSGVVTRADRDRGAIFQRGHLLWWQLSKIGNLHHFGEISSLSANSFDWKGGKIATIEYKWRKIMGTIFLSHSLLHTPPHALIKLFTVRGESHF